jgi:hypothetical protein
MDIFITVYNLFQAVKTWYYTIDEIDYYMISEDGQQLPLYKPACKPIWGFLTVYNKNYEYKYKFSRHFNISDPIQPTYKWFGLRVTVRGKQYNLEVNEYMVAPNILFTDPIKLWICYKLGIHPTTKMIISIINEDVHLVNISTVELYQDNYIKMEQT